MKVIKYWKVQLLQLSQPSSKLPGVINARNLVESLLFEGYSKDKPKINLGSGVNIELFTAPDSLETRIFRDHLVDSVRCFPVCEDDGDDEIDGDREERSKPPSREAKIEYIKQAFRKGFSSSFENAASPTLLDDVTLDYVYLSCWIWCRNYHVDDGSKACSPSLKDVVNPVIKWLNENADPHTSVNIDATSAYLLTGEIAIHTEELIKEELIKD